MTLSTHDSARADGQALTPLAGVRVLDLSQVEVGPCATQILADFGALVLKVERPGRGDLLRHVDPYSGDDPNASAYFLSLNRNKTSVAIDFQTDSGREQITSLLESADVLIENFRPGTLDKYGLGYDQLHARFPRLVYASATGFGSTGPLSHLGGQDLLAQAVSGMALHNRDDEGRPRFDSVPIADFGTGVLLATGILLALIARDKGQDGQRVEVNLLDTLLAMQTQELTQWLMRGIETNFLTDFVAGAYECEDGWIALAGYFVQRPLKTLCETFDLTLGDNSPGRSENAGHDTDLRLRVESALRASLSRESRHVAIGRLREAGFLCAECLDYRSVVSHPQVATNGSLLNLQFGSNTFQTIASPIHLSATPAAYTSFPPGMPVSSGPIAFSDAGAQEDGGVSVKYRRGRMRGMTDENG